MEKDINPRLIAIRKLMREYNIDAYLVTRRDPHMCERIPPCDERLNYMSSFTGTNGIGLITHDEALLWTDERYYIQAPKEMFPGWKMMKLEADVPTWTEWVNINLKSASKVGYNPLVVAAGLNTKRTSIEKLQINKNEFEPLEIDLVEQIWTDRPEAPSDKVFIYDLKYSGETSQSKFNRIYSMLKSRNAKIYVITQLEEIAWTLNLRGSDNELTPYFISYLILNFDNEGYISGKLYINKKKIDETVADYLKSIKIETLEYEEIFNDLKKIESVVYLTEQYCNSAILSSTNQYISEKNSVIELLKGNKNKTEVEGIAHSHRRDGSAIVRYFAWLENQLNILQNQNLDEFEAANVLTNFRSQEKDFVSKSFLVTSAIGENGAIIHYKPKPGLSAKMNNKEMYLLDSGGQYIDGTTDTTRTIHFGTPTQEEKDRYTRVLLGNLDVERLKFPMKNKISGSDIDVLARRHLFEYKVGLTYGHGTGHGVGHFLNVHEGPHGISRLNKVPLETGMVVSNEPGFYKEGSFGIRIENILIVEESEKSNFYRFRNVTRVPYERELIDNSLLEQKDIEFIDAYHQLVYNELKDLLIEKNDQPALKWLENKTRKLLS